MPSADLPSALAHSRQEVVNPPTDVATWKLVVAALLLQLALIGEAGLIILTDAFVPGSQDISSIFEDAWVMALNRLLVIGLWALGVGVTYYWSRKRGVFERLFTWRSNRTVLVASLAAVDLHVLDNVVVATFGTQTVGPLVIGGTRSRVDVRHARGNCRVCSPTSVLPVRIVARRRSDRPLPASRRTVSGRSTCRGEASDSLSPGVYSTY